MNARARLIWRAWAPEKISTEVEGNIAELLDGLSVRAVSDAPSGR